MTDLGGLGAVALLLYLWECAAWVPEGAEAFRLPLRGRGRLARESWSFQRPRGRIVLGSLLPGTGGVALCETRPPRFSPAGVCACDEHGAAGEPIPWERLESVRADGRGVRSGPRTIWKAGTAAYAAHVARLAEDVRAASPERRGVLIERELERLLDDGAVRAQAARLRRASWVLRGFVWAMTLILAGAVPLALARESLAGLLVSLAAAWALAATTAVLYGRRRRSLVAMPGSGGHALSMLLLPLAALRADDLLAREAFATHHALAVARGSDAVPPWTRAAVPDDDSDAAPCCAAGAWIDAAWRLSLESHSAAEAAGARSRAPRRESPDAVAYCPRCLQQYARAGQCADCASVTLQPIE